MKICKTNMIIPIIAFFSVACEKEKINPLPGPLYCDRGVAFTDSNIKPWLDYYNIPGLCIAVIENDKIDWVKGYGVIDKSSGGLVNEVTIFQVASISKPIAAAIVMNVYNEHGLSIDGDINEYLKAWKIPQNEYNTINKTTIRQLLGHTGGINISGFAGYNIDKAIPTLLEILNGNGPANNPPIYVEYTPSTKYQYSGGGYEILQLFLEETYGKNYEQIAEEVLFNPLDMKMSSNYNPKNLINTASGHSNNGKVVNGKWNKYPELCAAGLWTSVIDLSKFMIDFQKTNRNISNNILTSDLTKEM